MAIETLGAALKQISRVFAVGSITGFSDAQLLERFVSGQDPAAFEGLVAHHGPMVLGVCLGILKDPNDVDDAFQATFLILVSKSGTLRNGNALGPWLYRVAHRVAIRANAAAARRRACERRAGQMATTISTSGPSGANERLQTLHQEIARLPEKIRRAVILCDLQSIPQDRAAGELRLSIRTLQRRLSEGRERLKARLIRRGLAPEGVMPVSAFLSKARSAVPAALSDATVQAALATASQSLTVGVVSAEAKELTPEVLRTMALQKLAWASATLVAAGVIAWGASASLVSLNEDPSKKTGANPDSRAQRTAKTNVPPLERKSLHIPDKVTVRGRVLQPDGRPASGAKIYRTPLAANLRRPYPYVELATTNADGGFEFLADKRLELMHENEKYFLKQTVVTAAAPNYGVAWEEVPDDGRSDGLTLQLVDDQPISGQIVDLEGKPVPGATLHVLGVRAADGDDLGPWLEAANSKIGLSESLEWQYFKHSTLAPAPIITADAEGRFRFSGFGRNRLVLAQLEGPTIASERLKILTRTGEPIDVVRYRQARVASTTYYGSSFRHAAAPTKPIVGVVRDKDTKKPLAGITVRSHKLANDLMGGNDIVHTKTDDQGRYRLVGMPKGVGNWITAVPDNDQPYLISRQEVADSPGLDAITADLELKHGIWIEGKVTDKVTGEPLRAK